MDSLFFMVLNSKIRIFIVFYRRRRRPKDGSSLIWNLMSNSIWMKMKCLVWRLMKNPISIRMSSLMLKAGKKMMFLLTDCLRLKDVPQQKILLTDWLMAGLLKNFQPMHDLMLRFRLTRDLMLNRYFCYNSHYSCYCSQYSNGFWNYCSC